MAADSYVGGRRAVAAWCIYDWANSAFPTVIATFVFSAYFTQGIARTPTEGTAQWSWAVTASGFAIAVLSPVLGAVADAAGPRKPWLLASSVLCAAATALLWFAAPAPAWATFALVTFAVANAAFELGTVFYNAMLPDMVPEHRLGRVSGWGWGLGYMGGLACLVFVLLAFVQAQHPLFGLGKAQAEDARIAGPVAGLWFLIFAVPLFILTPDVPSRRVGASVAVRRGLVQLGRSLWNIRRYANIARYLVARMIYTDGLNTLFSFGGIYAAGSFGMDLREVILFGITLNITAGLGAAAFAWVDDWIGAKRTVLIALGAIIVLGSGILLVRDKATFWGLCLALGIFFGPAQAASRSLMARLAPAALRTEMFGLYALSGKATAFAGPFVLGWATLIFDSQRAGMATVLAFFVVGGLMLLAVREETG